MLSLAITTTAVSGGYAYAVNRLPVGGNVKRLVVFAGIAYIIWNSGLFSRD